MASDLESDLFTDFGFLEMNMPLDFTQIATSVPCIGGEESAGNSSTAAVEQVTVERIKKMPPCFDFSKPASPDCSTSADPQTPIRSAFQEFQEALGLDLTMTPEPTNQVNMAPPLEISTLQLDIDHSEATPSPQIDPVERRRLRRNEISRNYRKNLRKKRLALENELDPLTKKNQQLKATHKKLLVLVERYKAVVKSQFGDRNGD